MSSFHIPFRKDSHFQLLMKCQILDAICDTFWAIDCCIYRTFLQLLARMHYFSKDSHRSKLNGVYCISMVMPVSVTLETGAGCGRAAKGILISNNNLILYTPIYDGCQRQSAKVPCQLPWERAHWENSNNTPQPMCSGFHSIPIYIGVNLEKPCHCNRSRFETQM